MTMKWHAIRGGFSDDRRRNKQSWRREREGHLINPRIQNDDVKTSALIFIKMDAFCLEAIDPLINIPHHDAADVFSLCHMIIWIIVVLLEMWQNWEKLFGLLINFLIIFYQLSVINRIVYWANSSGFLFDIKPWC